MNIKLSESKGHLVQDHVLCSAALACLAQPQAGFTYSFLGLLLGGTSLLGLLDDGVEGEAEPGHAGQVTDVDVEVQPLLPHRLRAHVHLRARHCLAQHLIAVEQTCLHHQLRAGKIRGHHESTGTCLVC